MIIVLWCYTRKQNTDEIGKHNDNCEIMRIRHGLAGSVYIYTHHVIIINYAKSNRHRSSQLVQYMSQVIKLFPRRISFFLFLYYFHLPHFFVLHKLSNCIYGRIQCSRDTVSPNVIILYYIYNRHQSTASFTPHGKNNFICL